MPRPLLACLNLRRLAVHQLYLLVALGPCDETTGRHWLGFHDSLSVKEVNLSVPLFLSRFDTAHMFIIGFLSVKLPVAMVTG
jgi:hypothetical protein